MMDATIKRFRGGQIGFVKTLTGGGDIIAPTVGGLLIDLASLQSAFWAAGLAGLVGAVLSFALIWR